jgi:hypothetical protein
LKILASAEKWPLSTRIGGHFESESPAGFDQNMHVIIIGMIGLGILLRFSSIPRE